LNGSPILNDTGEYVLKTSSINLGVPGRIVSRTVMASSTKLPACDRSVFVFLRCQVAVALLPFTARNNVISKIGYLFFGLDVVPDERWEQM